MDKLEKRKGVCSWVRKPGHTLKITKGELKNQY
jgi:hypothetical protein